MHVLDLVPQHAARHGHGLSRPYRLSMIVSRMEAERSMQALVVSAPDTFAVERVARPRPGDFDVALPGPRGRDLRHRPAHHPGPLPGVLAEGVAADPRARVVRRRRRGGGGRGGARMGGRHARGGHLARRLRLLPPLRRGPVQHLRELRRRRACTSSTATTPPAPTRSTSVHSIKSVFAGARRPLRRGGGDARPDRDRAAHGDPRRPPAGRHRGRRRSRRDGAAGGRVRARARRRAGGRRRPRRAAGQGGRAGPRDRSTSRPPIRWRRSAS